jgi:hypothetical protein
MSRHSGRSQNDDRHDRPFSLSPPPRQPHHHGGDRNIVTERVVEKSSSSLVFPTLTRTNYTEWSLVMKVNLQAAGLREVIHSGDGDYREDRSALIVLLRAVSSEMQAGLAVKATAREAWEAIRTVRVGVDHVKEVNAERLHREFDDISFKLDESIEDFSLRLNSVASELRVLDDDISDKEVIK